MSLSPEAKLLLSKHPELCKEIAKNYELLKYANLRSNLHLHDYWTDFVQKHTEPKRDWEIVSFMSNVPNPDESWLWFQYNPNRWSRNGNVTQPYTTEEILKNENYHIHSVRRLSDGEVFTVDEFAADQYGAFKIKYFQINEDDSITVFSYIERDGVYLKDLKKSKPVLSETPLKGCGVCGGRFVMIRGKYPKSELREICPTCAYERLEQINEISRGANVPCKSNESK